MRNESRLRRGHADWRFRLTGDLLAQAPVHVGGLGGNADTDMALAVDGSGSLYIPGTSLAGAIRAAIPLHRGLWGSAPARGRANTSDRASQVFVEDGAVSIPTGLDVEIREGVGIDRISGTAAEHIKYNRAILPRGSRIWLVITVECIGGDEPMARAMLGAMKARLEGEGIRIGAARTRGLGHVKLQDAKLVEQQLNTRDGMLRALGVRDCPRWAEWDSQETAPVSPELRIQIDWKPEGPVMVKAESAGVAVDMLPLLTGTTSGDKTGLSLVMPGSSIKGALRSQAERICRTVVGEDAPHTIASKQRFLDQMAQFDLIEHLFGAVRKQARGPLSPAADDSSGLNTLDDASGKATQLSDAQPVTEQHAPSEAASAIAPEGNTAAVAEGLSEQKTGPAILPGRGALFVDDCYASGVIEPDRWAQVQSVTNCPAIRNALDGAGLSNMQQAFHVAIDRWTGGAANTALYSTLEPFGVTWDCIHLTVDLCRLPKDRCDAALCLLFLTLRDMGEGRIPLGFGVNRGMGAISVGAASLEGPALDGDLAGLACRLNKADPAGLPVDLKDRLVKAWCSWYEAVRAHQQPTTPPEAPKMPEHGQGGRS